MLTNFKSFLSKPADISVITTYRIFFGFCLLLHAYRYTPIEKITKDFVVPKFFFSFSIFQWLHLPILNAAGFNLLFTFMGISAFCVMVGLFYRYSLSILLITQIYYALLEKSYFPDPNYLYILITFLMFFIDANSQCSVDVILTPRIKKRIMFRTFIFGCSGYNSLLFSFILVFQNFFTLIGSTPNRCPFG